MATVRGAATASEGGIRPVDQFCALPSPAAVEGDYDRQFNLSWELDGVGHEDLFLLQ